MLETKQSPTKPVEQLPFAVPQETDNPFGHDKTFYEYLLKTVQLLSCSPVMQDYKRTRRDIVAKKNELGVDDKKALETLSQLYHDINFDPTVLSPTEHADINAVVGLSNLTACLVEPSSRAAIYYSYGLLAMKDRDPNTCAIHAPIYELLGETKTISLNAALFGTKNETTVTMMKVQASMYRQLEEMISMCKEHPEIAKTLVETGVEVDCID